MILRSHLYIYIQREEEDMSIISNTVEWFGAEEGYAPHCTAYGLHFVYSLSLLNKVSAGSRNSSRLMASLHVIGIFPLKMVLSDHGQNTYVPPVDVIRKRVDSGMLSPSSD